ncbi:hypothetical protein [Pseudoroseicyclus tamaricis]|uniref:Uncharacterized protein n=1 Tax=Pseudoroseicyclus tamaricis TaxID=2705421 RepID=A0A6B2JXB8_9RHOB|nr:hypothetical protein [Pseudoroseicyclus tamaricis]NDV02878.1 hypothetical protein [Pseudoroseicyclus tamaricis]
MFTSLAPPLFSRARRESVTMPAPPALPATAPLLMSDCATPLHGETLLSLLWKRMDGAED